MPGLVPGIHVFLVKQGVDGRDEPGHDAAERQCNWNRPTLMSVLPLVDIAPLLPARGALIGLDLGTKTIGVAASDPDRRLAAGVETIARKTFTADAQRIATLAAERAAI